MSGKGSTASRVRQRLRQWRYAYVRFTHHFTRSIAFGSDTLALMAFVASLGCVVLVVLYVGFEHSPAHLRQLHLAIRAAQWVFLANILYNLLLAFRRTVRQTRFVKWVVDLAVLLTLLPLLYPHPDHPWLPWLEEVLYSDVFLFSVVLAYSLVDISFGIIRLLGRRTNPSLILSGSFLTLIVVGTLLLMMPRCHLLPLDFVDALFLSTSAVCITGLSPVDISTTLSPMGLAVLSVLIQIGGLGVMTFASFFALFFSGNASIYNQLMVKDMIYSKTLNSLLPTLLYILGVTLAIEAIGSVAIFLCVHGTLEMTLDQELVFSGFHALSAFCNAGFSNLDGGLSNPLLLHSDQSIYLVASALIFAGGIGFPILMNFKVALGRHIRRLWRSLLGHGACPMPRHLYDLNTKVVLVTTAWIFGISTLLFFIFEYSNTLAGMSLWDKLVQSVFNSFVPRSSGFASVPATAMMPVTLVMFVVLMWIGGASQSMAGGIKVNTFATMWLNLRAVVSGRDRVTAYGRTISPSSIRRAHAVIALSIVAYTVYAMILLALEPHLSARALLYEAASAIFTVGTSLGITPCLSTASKILLCTAMFLGRVGLISLLMGVVGTRTDPAAKFPTDNIIIN